MDQDHIGIPPEEIPPEEIEREIFRLQYAVDVFAAGMKDLLAQKVREGRRGWDDPTNRPGIYQSLMEQASEVPLAFEREVHVANYAMMLFWSRHNIRHEPTPG